MGFWIADSYNINTWMISSSMIIGGLSWWQAWICVWVGYTISACFIVMNGRIGAMYHIGFPVANRASFGIWGGLWPVFNRAAMGKCRVTQKVYMNSPISAILELTTDILQPASGMVYKHTLAATACIS